MVRHPVYRPVVAGLVLLTLGLSCAARAQKVEQARGKDPKVDYESLRKYGPWDDRNYELTAADLELLAPDEEKLVAPLPAFFRVQLRRNWPSLQKEGPAQYPRNALQIFLQEHEGYLIDGKLYTGVTLREGRYVVLVDDEAGTDEEPPPKQDEKTTEQEEDPS